MKNKASSDAIQEAKEYAFLLLKYRLRSEKEIRERLQRKGFGPQTIEDAVGFLKQKKFLDDDAFAKLWISSRIKKPFGMRRIRQELRIKGIDTQTIDKRFADLKGVYSEERVIDEIVRKKLDSQEKDGLQAAKRRLYAYLLRKGFSPDKVIDALSNE